MKGRLFLLLLIVTVDTRTGRNKHYPAISRQRVGQGSGGTREQADTDMLMKTRTDSTCIKRQLSFNEKKSDDEIEDEIGELGTVFDFRGRKVIYKIDNGPVCSELTSYDIKRIIDEAAATWNKVENANVLLINIDEADDKQSGNESEEDKEADKDNDFNNKADEDFNNAGNEVDQDFNNDIDFNYNFNSNGNAESDDEFNGFEVDELKMPNEPQNNKITKVDIIISFEPCQHLKHRNRKPNLNVETFPDCETVYAHAHSFGDIHFNTLMTWTDRTYSKEEDLMIGEYVIVKPHLYSIALHEFGHSLGLRHTDETNAEDVMFWDFSGMRKYEKLEFSQNDITNLQIRYPVESEWDCKDKSTECSKEMCNNAELRPFCPGTCGDCDECGKHLADDYLKCSDKICDDRGHPLRKYCRKTCKLCEECPELPKNISHLTSSNTALPVKAGEAVTVTCEADYELDGDDIITCVGMMRWRWEVEEPECQPKPGPAPIKCKDRRRDCKTKKKKKKCSKRKIKRSCPMTCGQCQ